MSTVRVLVPNDLGTKEVSVDGQTFNVNSDGTITLPAHQAEKLIATGMGFKYGIEIIGSTKTAFRDTPAAQEVRGQLTSDDPLSSKSQPLATLIEQQLDKAKDPNASPADKEAALAFLDEMIAEFEATSGAVDQGDGAGTATGVAAGDTISEGQDKGKDPATQQNSKTTEDAGKAAPRPRPAPPTQ